MEEKLLTPEQVCAALNVSIQTLRLWDELGKLSAIRTVGNHRRYKQSDIYKFIGIDKSSEVVEESVALYLALIGVRKAASVLQPLLILHSIVEYLRSSSSHHSTKVLDSPLKVKLMLLLLLRH